MKLNYRFMLFTLMVGVFLGLPQETKAQDTLRVSWSDNGIDPVHNRLRDVIAADTLAGGARNPSRVYLLEKGGYYWNNDRIDNTGYHLRLVGETPDPSDPDFGNPAVLQRVNNAEGNVDDKLITGNGGLTLKNVYVIGCDDDGVQDAYQPMELSGSGQRYEFDNVVFERSNFAIPAFTNPGNDISFTNCVFRNLIGSSQQWEGRGTSIWIDQDTVIIENCTFFNVGFTAFQLEGGAANYVRFNHNTLVNVGRNLNAGNWWREAYFTNNLIYNGFWHGEGASDILNPNRDPEAYHAGIFSIGDLPSKYGPEEGRRIAFTNVAAFRDPAFANYYADSIRAQPLIGTISNIDYFPVYDQMVARDTMWADPQLATTFERALIDSMLKNIQDLRAGITPATRYFWGIPELDPGVRCDVCAAWPLPEDFSYSNSSLLTYGTDGLPLGDLNWFPTQKAQWEANKDQYIRDIEDIPGGRISFEVSQSLEAEDGELGGDAAIESFEGFSYFQMDGGGFIQWDFDVPTAGEYDLNVWTHMRGNDTRGQHTEINGVRIHDTAFGYGELIYSTNAGPNGPNPHEGMPLNEWTWVRWTQADLIEAGALTFPAGQNVIRITSSWGYQNFAGIDLLEPGTENVVVSLRAPDASFDIVTPIGEGAPWTPSRFKSVAMNATGTITWNVNAPTDGRYRIAVFYQNYGSPVGGQINVDGTAAATVDFDSNPDSTGLDLLSSNFSLTAGSHSITLAGSQIKADYIQLIREVVLTSVAGRGDLPQGYALMQNYPNPFNPSTTIDFALGKNAEVKLTIYNLLGQKVATLLDNRKLNAGNHTVVFDASKLASGVYFYRLEAGDFQSHKRMLFLK